MKNRTKLIFIIALLYLAMLVFGFVSVLAAANAYVKNNVDLNYIACYEMKSGSEINAYLPAACTSIVFGNSNNYKDVIETANSVYVITKDNSQNVKLYYKSDIKTAYILSSKTIIMPEDCSKMFYFLNKLTNITFENITTENVTNMESLFSYCTNLESINLELFKTDKVTNFSSMFYKCEKLKEIASLESLNLSEATTVKNMFACCYALKSLDLSTFNTGKVTDFSQLVFNCKELRSINLSNISVENAKNFTSMFYGCMLLEQIDLSSFNTTNVNSTTQMFAECSSLSTVFIGEGWDMAGVVESINMFYNCISLTFGDGSNYDQTKTDVTYAVAGDSGYLTLKTA